MMIGKGTIKTQDKLDMVLLAYNPSTQEAEQEDQSGLHSETMSQNTKQTRKKQ
jgi:hypothetical protein